MIAAQIPRVLIADPLAPNGLALLREWLDVVEANDHAALRSTISQSDALVVRSRTLVTDELLERGERLQLVARAGIGVDNIDVGAATNRGILVINAPLGNVRSTSEHTFALIFALARRVVAADRAVRDGTWKSGYEGMQLGGKRLGVIGAGKVGRQVAGMATGIGMDVVAYDPYLPAEVWPSLGLTPIALDELLDTADIVTLHVPLAEETRHLLGAPELARMKPGSCLINCARGGLVDEIALVQALTEGHLAGAALDVYEQEPLPEDSPLVTAPNLILTPHVAASTREAQMQVSTDIAVQVLDFFAGRPVAYPVNPSVLTKGTA
jgi:D-3-phosphoglycerate dehydrogenase / 2-oxoglutarate reductase